MIRRLSMVVLLAILALFMGASAASATTESLRSVPTYTYDTQHDDDRANETALERGLPDTTYDDATTHTAVDATLHGGSSRPPAFAAYAYTAYDLGASFAKADSSGSANKVLALAELGDFSALPAGLVAAKTGPRADDAFEHGFKYHPRIRQRGVQDPRAHNFPYSFDDVILKQKPTTQADGSLLYRKPGAINGKDGTYEIALNPDTGTIFHRTWRSR